ncbi:hypothetical protein HPB47_003030 [Ixodes persulcatus]|uniref:Uncharacterized protein n=1 Tax=Ixodes persulcatus TaxID=34615 RepID=A0AC60PJL8_IXOPE|nr:hypothetical protein HPB47_003030 [Ixodes persulcatus]
MGIAGYLLLVRDIPCWPIYRMFPGIAVGITVFGLLVCALLYVKGTLWPSPGEWGSSGSCVFDFYWGLELYPRIGKHLDIKQWSICRVALAVWQFFVLVSWKAQVEHSGWNWLMAASAILQSSYILKCILAEDWYINGFEFARDRAGHYLVFGSMSFQGIYYSVTSMYLVEHCPQNSALLGLTVIALGFLCGAERAKEPKYEVQFQRGQDCGGAYVKLLSDMEKNGDQRQFRDKSPYTIMLGPDKCGTDHKFDEMFKDKRPHPLTLVLTPDNCFKVLVDQRSEAKSSFIEDFEPHVNPPVEVNYPMDTRPSWTSGLIK